MQLGDKKMIYSMMIIFVILAIGSGLFFGNRRQGEEIAAEGGAELELEEINNKKDKQEKKIYVHVAGEVKSPGVIKVTEESRVFDVIEAAGGRTPRADLSSINLAKPVCDGQKIMIPARLSEEERTASNRKKVENLEEELININQAGSEELQELNGIGPSKAESIIDYREDINRFSDKDELLEVSGIGEKTLEKIKDEITLW